MKLAGGVEQGPRTRQLRTAGLKFGPSMTNYQVYVFFSSICVSVCLSVCQQDYAQMTRLKRLMKLGGGDQQPGAHAGIVSLFFNIVRKGILTLAEVCALLVPF